MIIGSKFSVIIGTIFLVYCEISYLRKRDIKVKTPSVSKLTKTTSNQKVEQVKIFLNFFYIRIDYRRKDFKQIVLFLEMYYYCIHFTILILS